MTKLKNLFSPGNSYERLKALNPRLKKLQNGIDHSLFKADSGYKNYLRSKYSIPENQAILLSVGRLVPLKNHSFALKIVKRLKELKVPLRYIIVGEGPLYDRIKQEIEQLDLLDEVILAGAVRNTELPKYYNGADLFLMTSKYESSPIVVIEALSCGKPIVATNVGGIPELMSDGKDGYVINLDDVEGFSLKIQELLKDKDLYNSFSKNALAHGNSYSWEKTGDEYFEFFLS